MINLLALGTEGKSETSRYQVMITDKTDKSIDIHEYPRVSRFFDYISERNEFISRLEKAVNQTGGRFVHSEIQSHPYFAVFLVFDQHGNQNYSITVYQ